MLKFLLPFLSPFLLGTGLYYVENVWASLTRRWALFLLITSSSQWLIYHSPYSAPILNFITGLGSAWYVIWSGDLLFVLDPRRFQRIRRPTAIQKGAKCREYYYWQPLPGRLTLQRAFWVFDLVTNLREIGWRHGLHVKDIPDPSEGMDGRQTHLSRRRFCVRHIITVVCTHLLMSLYEKPPYNARYWLAKSMPTYLQREAWEAISLWAWLIYIYLLLTISHSTMVLIAVGIFGQKWLGIAGLPWMYPPIFGPVGCFFTIFEIRFFWSQWWHNLFRRSLLSVSRKIVPDCTRSRRLQRLLYGCAGFVLSGYFHAAACYAVRRDLFSAGRAFLFFCLQPIPVAVQGYLEALLSRCSKVPAAAMRCMISLIGILWVSWTFGILLWTPAILHVRETFHVPWNIWSPAVSYLNEQIVPKLLS